MTDWYYAINGDSRGPISEAKISALIRNRKIAPETLVWHEGMVQWQEARGHFSFENMPPPISGAAPPRGFIEAIRVCFTNYVTFSGRASRSEFWFFMLFTWLGSFAVELLTGQSGIASGIFSLVTLLPTLAVSVRRLHDTDRTGWWMCGGLVIIAVSIPLFILFVAQGLSPILGPTIISLAWLAYSIVLIVFFCQRGTPGANRFG